MNERDNTMNSWGETHTAGPKVIYWDSQSKPFLEESKPAYGPFEVRTNLEDSSTKWPSPN